ncbi:MAG: type II toxin-antitoxin system VapC family toxin [Geminicoccaceae bacterium]
MSQPFVVDASVAAKWLFQEHDSELAETLRGWPLIAPPLLWLECGSVIWSRIRRGLVDKREVPALLAHLRAVPVEPVTMKLQLDLILRVAIELGHPVYDCAYLALAVANDLRVITADRRFLRAVQKSDLLARHIVVLGDLAH